MSTHLQNSSTSNIISINQNRFHINMRLKVYKPAEDKLYFVNICVYQTLTFLNHCKNNTDGRNLILHY